MKTQNFILTLLLFVLFGCFKDGELNPCEGQMFGKPITNTGLSSEKCMPSCECLGFATKEFTPQEINKLKDWSLVQPFQEVNTNPYQNPLNLPPSDGWVCGVIVENLSNKTYRLQNYESKESAEKEGAIVTHFDLCGVCSTLEDLAVYAENLDIGANVRQCGFQNFNTPFESLVGCIQDLGFTLPCAQIWAYNLRNTQSVCLSFCLNNDPYHLEDGSLSPCLECDEINSGPVFKAVAGRTRRNTGIASSICRFCEEVNPVEHNYPL